MTLNEIADGLDDIAVDMANVLMPANDDPTRAPRAYVLGIASHAVKQQADRLRSMAVGGTITVTFAQVKAIRDHLTANGGAKLLETMPEELLDILLGRPR